MGDKETPFNLFSSSGKRKPVKGEKIEDVAEVVPRPPAKAKKSSEQSFSYDPATTEMLNKIKDMQDAIASKLDYIVSKSGMSKEQVLKMVQGPEANKQDIEKMNADLKAFSQKVWGALDKDILPYKAPIVKGTTTEKERKSKTLGARRNWLRMP